MTGMCDKGCKEGWSGAMCDTACDETYYGINCTQSYGSNCVNFSCHHQTGNCKVYVEPLKESDPSNLHTVVGGSSAAIVMILIIAGIIIFLKRTGCFSRGKREEDSNDAQNTLAFSNVYQSVGICVENISGEKDSKMKPKLTETKKPMKYTTINEDVEIDEKIHGENPYGDIYVNEEHITDVELSHLEQIIEEKSRNENDCFKKEYATLLYGERYPCHVGKLPENIKKKTDLRQPFHMITQELYLQTSVQTTSTPITSMEYEENIYTLQHKDQNETRLLTFG